MDVNVDRLLIRFSDDRDSLSEKEHHILFEALRDDEKLTARLKEALVIDHLLAQTLSLDRGDFEAQVAQRIRDLQDQGRLLASAGDLLSRPAPKKRSTSRILRIRRQPASQTWGWGVAAAAGFAALVLVLLFSQSAPVVPAPRPTVPALSEARVPDSEPAPPESAPRRAEPTPRTVPDARPTLPSVPRPETRPETVPVPPKAEDRPAHPTLAPEAPRPSATRAAMAVVERTEGEAYVTDGTRRDRAGAGQTVLDHQGLQTVGAGSRAGIAYPDGTRAVLEARGRIEALSTGPAGRSAGKWLELSEGTLSAQVTPQQAGRALVISTPHAEATVLGTTLRIVVRPDPATASTRLEVREGKVRLTRKLDGKAVDVSGGFFAVVAPGVELKANRLPAEEVFLLAHRGTIQGGEWRFVQDPQAAGGVCVEALQSSAKSTAKLEGAPHVAFALRADAELEYNVWVRGRTTATDSPRTSDSIILEIPGASFTEAAAADRRPACGGPERALFDGYKNRPGYGWIGGDADSGEESVKVTVRFPRSGDYVLRLYAFEAPIRIDAILISSTQKTRPEDSWRGRDGK